MDNTIYGVFKYNNVPYAEITDESHKERLDKLIELIKKDEDLNRRLAMFYDRNMNIRDIDPQYTFDYISDLPDDIHQPIMELFLDEVIENPS